MGIRTPIRNSNTEQKTRNYSSEYENFRPCPRCHRRRRRQEGPTTSPTSTPEQIGPFRRGMVQDNLSEKAANNWSNKFANNVARFEARFERCGYYDENHEHGGPADRKRRAAEEGCLDIDSEFCRYDKSNPIRGIKQITSGFRKWAERYLANDKDGAFCKLQPAKQVAR